MKIELIVEQLVNNTMNEQTTTSDVSVSGPLATELIRKIYPESFVAQIAKVQPLKSSVGKFAYIHSLYTGSASNSQGLDIYNSRILTLSASGDFKAGDVFTASGAYGTKLGDSILYVDGNKKTIVVKCDNSASAVIVAGDIITKTAGDGSWVTATVTFACQNRTAVKKIMEDYGITTEIGTPNNIKLEVRTKNISTSERKLTSRMTNETVQDWKYLYGKSADETISDYLSNEIRQEIDLEVIEYIRGIAEPVGTIDMTKSAASGGGGAGDFSYDLILAMYYSSEMIVRETKRNRTMFVLCSPGVASILKGNALHTTPDPQEDNPYYIGKIGTYKLFCDIYNTSGIEYFVVGYINALGDKEKEADAGLIYCPYTHYFNQVTNPSDMSENFIAMSRYAYTRHPQDSGTGLADSDFFKIIEVQNIDKIGNFMPLVTW